MLDVARRKVEAAGREDMDVLELDLERDALPERRFDAIFTMMTLHHVMDLDGVLARFFELLRPGGALAIADLDAEDGSFHPPGMKVHHGFERDALGRRVAAAGFEDVAFSTCYEIAREDRSYPVFLASARRP